MEIAGQRIRVGRPALGLWGAYLAVGIALSALYFTLPTDQQFLLYDGIGLSAVVAILVGVTRHRPSSPLAWYLFAGGQLMFVVGDVLWNSLYAQSGEEVFPSIADSFYLGGYPLIAWALFLLVRSRAPGRDVASILDATIISVGVGVLTWSFLIAPYVSDPSLGGLEKSISVAYPLMDLLLLVVAARLFSIRDGRSISYWFLTWSIVALLLADSTYGYMTLHEGYPSGHPIDALWLMSYVLCGVAALHPSMKTISKRASSQSSRLTGRWVLLLTGASLLAPATLAIQYARSESLDIPVTVGGAAVLFILTLTRMAGLGRELERKRLVHKTLEMAERERERFAAELHDGPIQGLTVMTLNLELLRMDLEEDESRTHAGNLKELQERVSEQVVALRRLMAELRPPVLDERGLVQALIDYAHDVQQRSAIECSVQSNLEGRVEPWLELALYRVVQEALRNVEKHSQAAKAEISLARDGDRLIMTIKDDGAGFDLKSDSTMGREHFGLAAMRGRIENLGGHIQIQSRVGAGTAITVAIQLEVVS